MASKPTTEAIAGHLGVAAAMSATPIEELIGQTIVAIDGLNTGSEEVKLTLDSGKTCRFFHGQDCCENVVVNEIVGDVNDLIGTPIVVAEERVSGTREDEPNDYESCTWTFYTFRTHKGTVDVRWLGTSNGYYSEDVKWVLEPIVSDESI
jgi:hypothetical protein